MKTYWDHTNKERSEMTRADVENPLADPANTLQTTGV